MEMVEEGKKIHIVNVICSIKSDFYPFLLFFCCVMYLCQNTNENTTFCHFHEIREWIIGSWIQWYTILWINVIIKFQRGIQKCQATYKKYKLAIEINHFWDASWVGGKLFLKPFNVLFWIVTKIFLN